MQRFFLHLKHLDQLVPDREGVELVSVGAAEHEAMQSIRDMAAEALREEADFTLQSIRICDGKGEMLAEVFSQDVLSNVFSPAVALL
jgi:hypothetical protein